MSKIRAVNSTVQTTDLWVRDLMLALGWNDPDRVFLVLRATLHALRDRLPLQEVVQLGAQLPMLIRGAYYERWEPAGKPLKERHRAEFLEQIARQLPEDPFIEPELAARAVFHLLGRKISHGEIGDVKQVLPAEIRDLWA